MLLFSTLVDRLHRARLLVGLLALPATAAMPTIDFLDRPKGGSLVSEDGVVSLAWAAAPAPWVVVLQQDAAAEFTDPVVRYRGPDKGSVLTGLPEGVHHFRLRREHPTTGAGAWTDPLRVEVTFMDRSRLFGFLGLGGIVVLATAGTIISGYFRHRAESKRGGPA